MQSNLINSTADANGVFELTSWEQQPKLDQLQTKCNHQYCTLKREKKMMDAILKTDLKCCDLIRKPYLIYYINKDKMLTRDNQLKMIQVSQLLLLHENTS